MSNKSSVVANHTHIKYHIVKDEIRDQTINVKHTSMTMLALYLLKADHLVFFKHVVGIGVMKVF